MVERWWIYILPRILFPPIWGFKEKLQSYSLQGTQILHKGLFFVVTSIPWSLPDYCLMKKDHQLWANSSV